MQWYKHHLDAYSRDTPELSVTEHGAYRLLLDAYYQREGPLPCDKELLYRICRAHRAHELKAVDFVVRLFFTNSDSTIKNKRADQEILKYQQRCSANRRPNRQRIVNESSQKLESTERTDKPTSKPVDNFQEKNPKPRKLDDYLYTTHQEALRRIKTAS